MDDLTYSVLATFDSDHNLQWDLKSSSEVNATFSVQDIQATVRFVDATDGWTVAFDATRESTSLGFRILSGVFLAVKEFLEVRQPERLVFTTKSEPLGHIYESYLERKNTELAQLGYEPEAASKATPLAEFAIRKTSPSSWTNYRTT